MLDAVGGGHAWQGAAGGSGGVALRLPLPAADAARCVLLAEGWDAATAASATARWGNGPAVPEFPFLSLHGAVAGCVLDRPAAALPGTAEAILLQAARPPLACRVLALRVPRPAGGGGIPASILPRCLGLPAAAPAAEAGDPDLPAQVAEDLAAGRLGEALAACAAALLAGGDTAPVRHAARFVLDHLARHPMARDPRLGIFLGALLAA
jgi:hypothetical protein